ncbi:hypothetical protein [Chitinolyticbacter meiyuanensis]|uniref:hypothetical protein n=1 Tax=Chitinolyticbacter meiyuanensis TaxID=682798 RepID=UPI0011E58C55|nr:hypothetical protein [Chitinolyticbacter meiyuanensis]
MILPGSLAAFFASYRAAFDALDGEAVATHYHEPSGIVTAEGYVHWPKRADACANMVALCALYREQGYATAGYELVAYLPQGLHGAFVTLAWQITRRDGLPPWRFHTAYNLLHTAAGWHVLLCTAYDEQRLDR